MNHIDKQDFSSKGWVRPLGGLRGRGRGQNSTFSEYGHVAYQIKGNDTCSNMVANILCRPPSPDPGGVKIHLFQNMGHVAYQIKGNDERSTYSVLTHTLNSWDGVKGQNNFFYIFLAVMLHIKLKGTEHRAPCKHLYCPCTFILSLHTPSTPDGVKRSIHFFS